MSKGFQTALVVIGAVIAGSVLLLVGIAIGRSSFGVAPFSSWNTMMGSGAGMHVSGPYFRHQMMDDYQHPDECEEYGMSDDDDMGSWMMPGFSSGSIGSTGLLSIEDATEAVTSFTATIGDDDLIVGDVMVFDNHAYAQIIEESTGIGIMELLVDPATKKVYPEMGPNMMWNLKYGGMGGLSGFGMMDMMPGYSDDDMMGDQGYTGFNRGMGFSADLPDPYDEMTISSEEALELAQRYLESSFPGMRADDHAAPFYGYYTIHIEQDGETVGMLSVNGFTGDVFVHAWHGNFVEMS